MAKLSPPIKLRIKSIKLANLPVPIIGEIQVPTVASDPYPVSMEKFIIFAGGVVSGTTYTDAVFSVDENFTVTQTTGLPSKVACVKGFKFFDRAVFAGGLIGTSTQVNNVVSCQLPTAQGRRLVSELN